MTNSRISSQAAKEVQSLRVIQVTFLALSLVCTVHLHVGQGHSVSISRLSHIQVKAAENLGQGHYAYIGSLHIKTSLTKNLAQGHYIPRSRSVVMRSLASILFQYSSGVALPYPSLQPRTKTPSSAGNQLTTISRESVSACRRRGRPGGTVSVCNKIY